MTENTKQGLDAGDSGMAKIPERIVAEARRLVAEAVRQMSRRGCIVCDAGARDPLAIEEVARDIILQTLDLPRLLAERDELLEVLRAVWLLVRDGVSMSEHCFAILAKHQPKQEESDEE